MKKLSFVVLSLFLLVSQSFAIVEWNGLTTKSESKMKYFLHTGFMFDGVLRTAIFSYNLMSPVVCEVEFEVVYLGRVMVPKKAKLIGVAEVLKSDDRVNVTFTTIVFPDGSEIPIAAMALMPDGSAGIVGKIKRYKEKIPVKAVVSTLANAEIPGVGGAVVKELATQTQQEMSITPTYSISIKKDTPILIYNIKRIEY